MKQEIVIIRMRARTAFALALALVAALAAGGMTAAVADESPTSPTAGAFGD